MERQICLLVLSVLSLYTAIRSGVLAGEENWKAAYGALVLSYVAMGVMNLINDFWKEED